MWYCGIFHAWRQTITLGLTKSNARPKSMQHMSTRLTSPRLWVTSSKSLVRQDLFSMKSSWGEQNITCWGRYWEMCVQLNCAITLTERRWGCLACNFRDNLNHLSKATTAALLQSFDILPWSIMAWNRLRTEPTLMPDTGLIMVNFVWTRRPALSIPRQPRHISHHHRQIIHGLWWDFMHRIAGFPQVKPGDTAEVLRQEDFNDLVRDCFTFNL